MFAQTPDPPYVAVVFTSLRAEGQDESYAETAALMDRLASEQQGFLGVESARGEDGLGITVSYWTDRAAATAWKKNSRHLTAQQLGRDEWYERFIVRICRVEESRESPRG